MKRKQHRRYTGTRAFHGIGLGWTSKEHGRLLADLTKQFDEERDKTREYIAEGARAPAWLTLCSLLITAGEVNAHAEAIRGGSQAGAARVRDRVFGDMEDVKQEYAKRFKG